MLEEGTTESNNRELRLASYFRIGSSILGFFSVLSSAPHREWRARTLSSISWTTRRRRRALQATRRPTARPSRHCGGALVSNPGGAGGVVLESPTHAHTRNGAEGARAQGHLSLCLCRASLALSPVLLPPPPPPSGVAPVIGFIHATMLLVLTHKRSPKHVRSLSSRFHLSTSPLHPNRTQSAHGTGALRQRSSDAMNGGGHYPTYVFRCGGGQLWMWDVGCGRAMGGGTEGSRSELFMHLPHLPPRARAPLRLLTNTASTTLEPHEYLPHESTNTSPSTQCRDVP